LTGGPLPVGTGTLLDRLYPPWVRTALRSRLEPVHSPHPEEQRAVATAGEPRRREFLSARACAHRALAALGRDDGPVGVGPRRAPRWPSGVVGSIAHGGSWAGAAVADAHHALGIGLDVEPLDAPLPPEVAHIVLTDDERTRMAGEPAAAVGLLGTITFSAKECAYKCLFPVTGWELEFHDLTVSIDLAAGYYQLAVTDRFHGGRRRPPVLTGRLLVAGGHVFSGLYLSNGLSRLDGGIYDYIDSSRLDTPVSAKCT
jgi:4'-phosphopantetheinyl transferase EntD